MSPENFRVILELVGAIVIAFVSHQLTKSHYERKRRDDLADRDSARMLHEKEKKIALAQEYLNVCTEVSRIIIGVGLRAVAHKNADVVKADAMKVLPLMNVAPNILMSMQLLGNPELAERANQYTVLIYDEHQKMIELLIAFHLKQPIDEKMVLSRISEFSNKSGQISGRIQVLLDKLSSEIR